MEKVSTLLREIPLFGISGEYHHVDVDAFFLLMKGGIPAQVIRMDFEGASNVTDVRIDQRLPVGGVIIASLCMMFLLMRAVGIELAAVIV